MRVNVSDDNVERLVNMAKRMRKMALDMALSTGSRGSHIGGGFSSMEIMAVLYGEILNVNPRELKQERDRLLIGKGHCKLAHFPALVERGFIKEEDVAMYFAQNSGRLVGYPYDPSIGLEYSGGSLGMAISIGVGQAIVMRKKKLENRIFVLMGDGELNEGSVWEAFMSAAQFNLSNLVAIIDRNHLSYDSNTEIIMGIEDLSKKMESFNFNVVRCNGHNIRELLNAFGKISDCMPNVIICDTVKGKGLSFAENNPEWHQKAITQTQYEEALKDLVEGRVI